MVGRCDFRFVFSDLGGHRRWPGFDYPAVDYGSRPVAVFTAARMVRRGLVGAWAISLSDRSSHRWADVSVETLAVRGGLCRGNGGSLISVNLGSRDRPNADLRGASHFSQRRSRARGWLF